MTSHRHSRPSLSILPWSLGIVSLLLLAAAIALGQPEKPQPQHRMSGLSESHAAALPTALPTTLPTEAGSGEVFTTIIRRPTGPPLVHLDSVEFADPQGRGQDVACSTCHSVRPANLANKTPADLDQFHQKMEFAHGKLSCYSCHNPDDADTLRLADATPVTYPDVMTLCAQCHGPQARDFEHGAHGGMNGHWDLRRGNRTRNNCIDCHDPHVPKFPSMRPTFKPRDRFLNDSAADSGHQETSHE